jgi:hypothetical protein
VAIDDELLECGEGNSVLTVAELREELKNLLLVLLLKELLQRDIRFGIQLEVLQLLIAEEQGKLQLVLQV